MTKREILEAVAAGTLTPEEAAERLSALAETPAPDAGDDVPAPAAGGAVRRIRVVGDFRTAKISGDPGVAEAVADGPHTVRREGDTLVIDARTDDSGGEGAFSFSRSDRSPRVVIGLGSKPKPVSVRMNPSLPLEVQIDAGTVAITGVRSPIKGAIDAGAIKIEGFESPLDLSVDAGSVSASGTLRSGESRIRCDAGQVKIRLSKGSSVRVRAHADVGKVVVGAQSRAGIGIGEPQEVVFGDGEATLEIEGGIGRIKVEEA